MKSENISQKVTEIIAKYETMTGFNISTAYEDGGAENPFPRLGRAALNQLNGEQGATISRYAIWANTVRDNIIEAAKLIKENPGKSLKYLEISVNSLSSFSDIQAHFDPDQHGNIKSTPKKMDIE